MRTSGTGYSRGQLWICSEGEEREVESKGVGETRKFSGKGNGGRDRRKAAQGKTQEAVG